MRSTNLLTYLLTYAVPLYVVGPDVQHSPAARSGSWMRR